MSQHTPEELEKLMWSVAESGDQNAIDEFGERFPHLRPELVKRLAMVRQLRGVAKPSKPIREIPRFENRAIRPQPIRLGAWIGGGLVLATVAAAAFTVTRSLSASQTPKPETIVVQAADPKTPEPDIHYKPIPTPNGTTPNASVPTTPESTAQNQQNPTPPEPTTDPSLKPQSLKFERVRLTSAIEAVADSGGLEIQFAPGLPNPWIKIEYSGYSPIQILKDMGRKFGFTAFDNGPHKVLVIPARSSESPAIEELPTTSESPINPISPISAGQPSKPLRGSQEAVDGSTPPAGKTPRTRDSGGNPNQDLAKPSGSNTKNPALPKDVSGSNGSHPI